MTLKAITEGDDLVVRVNVTVNGDGATAKDLTGATVVGVAERGGERKTPTISGTLASGEIVATWDDPAFTEGLWSVQVRATLGAETQTVFRDELPVAASAFA